MRTEKTNLLWEEEQEGRLASKPPSEQKPGRGRAGPLAQKGRSILQGPVPGHSVFQTGSRRVRFSESPLPTQQVASSGPETVVRAEEDRGGCAPLRGSGLLVHLPVHRLGHRPTRSLLGPQTVPSPTASQIRVQTPPTAPAPPSTEELGPLQVCSACPLQEHQPYPAAALPGDPTYCTFRCKSPSYKAVRRHLSLLRAQGPCGANGTVEGEGALGVHHRTATFP